MKNVNQIIPLSISTVSVVRTMANVENATVMTTLDLSFSFSSALASGLVLLSLTILTRSRISAMLIIMKNTDTIGMMTELYDRSIVLCLRTLSPSSILSFARYPSSLMGPKWIPKSIEFVITLAKILFSMYSLLSLFSQKKEYVRFFCHFYILQIFSFFLFIASMLSISAILSMSAILTMLSVPGISSIAFHADISQQSF